MSEDEFSTKLGNILRIPSGTMEWSDQLFAAVDLMKCFVDDMYDLDYALFDVSAADEVQNEIEGLMERSCYSISEVVYHFAKKVDEDDWPNNLVSLLSIFFQDQFETRQRLLKVYWERYKAQRFRASRPSLEFMVDPLGILCTLVEQCSKVEFERAPALSDETTTDGIPF